MPGHPSGTRTVSFVGHAQYRRCALRVWVLLPIFTARCQRAVRANVPPAWGASALCDCRELCKIQNSLLAKYQSKHFTNQPHISQQVEHVFGRVFPVQLFFLLVEPTGFLDAHSLLETIHHRTETVQFFSSQTGYSSRFPSLDLLNWGGDWKW